MNWYTGRLALWNTVSALHRPYLGSVQVAMRSPHQKWMTFSPGRLFQCNLRFSSTSAYTASHQPPFVAAASLMQPQPESDVPEEVYRPLQPEAPTVNEDEDFYSSDEGSVAPTHHSMNPVNNRRHHFHHGIPLHRLADFRLVLLLPPVLWLFRMISKKTMQILLHHPLKTFVEQYELDGYSFSLDSGRWSLICTKVTLSTRDPWCQIAAKAVTC